MKAVIYARYSSDNQTEASIEGQLCECMEFAERTEIDVIGNYIDRALTAKSVTKSTPSIATKKTNLLPPSSNKFSRCIPTVTKLKKSSIISTNTISERIETAK